MPAIEYSLEIEEIGSGYKFDVETGYVISAAKRSNVITLQGINPMVVPV